MKIRKKNSMDRTSIKNSIFLIKKIKKKLKKHKKVL
jgi:hypothetical protein